MMANFPSKRLFTLYSGESPHQVPVKWECFKIEIKADVGWKDLSEGKEVDATPPSRKCYKKWGHFHVLPRLMSTRPEDCCQYQAGKGKSCGKYASCLDEHQKGRVKKATKEDVLFKEKHFGPLFIRCTTLVASRNNRKEKRQHKKIGNAFK